jgi:hypothetical protein
MFLIVIGAFLYAAVNIGRRHALLRESPRQQIARCSRVLLVVYAMAAVVALVSALLSPWVPLGLLGLELLYLLGRGLARVYRND